MKLTDVNVLAMFREYRAIGVTGILICFSGKFFTIGCGNYHFPRKSDNDNEISCH